MNCRRSHAPHAERPTSASHSDRAVARRAPRVAASCGPQSAHLLDGSRAANRLGWQWTVGAGTGRAYGFARAQVERRAPGLCAGCALRQACPIQRYGDDPVLAQVTAPAGVRADFDPAATAGPREVERRDEVSRVWLTAESLGDEDPALAANSDMPAVFVFDETLLARLRLTGKRLVFPTSNLRQSELANFHRNLSAVARRRDPR